ncbi:hypothetical protein AB1Y20_020490 [Prymnesium parvum]|uniref:RRM domain-containing protein n=1 Tax=Prymnesium parvum TaxID=97485 RepID=A0AB34JX31_PRYPA
MALGAYSAFVGNLAPMVSDHDLAQLFLQSGCRVTAARLALNRETGKPKPFGFVDFADQPSLDLAVSRFDGFLFHGRPLKVDPASSRAAAAAPPGKRRRDDRALMLIPGVAAGPAWGRANLTGEQLARPTALPRHAPLQAVTVANPQLASSEHINSLSDAQLWDFVSQVRVAVEEDVAQARRTLVENPTLGLALLKAQIRLKMVTQQSIMTVMARHEEQKAAAAQQQLLASMEERPQLPNESAMEEERRRHYLAQQQAQRQQQVAPPVGPDAQALLHQVMALTPEQVNALPQEQRTQIELLRQQMAGKLLGVGM